jgi:hypothetical protein
MTLLTAELFDFSKKLRLSFSTRVHLSFPLPSLRSLLHITLFLQEESKAAISCQARHSEGASIDLDIPPRINVALGIPSLKLHTAP